MKRGLDYRERLVERQGRLYYLRLSWFQRVQHILLIFFFTLLMITGIPLLFPESIVVERLFQFEGTFTLRGILHRLAAIGLILVSCYHLLYSIFTSRGKSDVLEMIPSVHDIRNFFASVSYKLGRRGEPPAFRRFNFIEKFEYLSVVWGSAIMIVTGAALWFPVAATSFFPLWVLDILRVIHGYEAALAFLAIIIWHMYNAHLNPDLFPMSKVWLNGLMDFEYLYHHHKLEFERMMASLPPETAQRIRNQRGLVGS